MADTTSSTSGGIDITALLNNIKDTFPVVSSTPNTQTNTSVSAGANADTIAAAVTDMGQAIAYQAGVKKKAAEAQGKVDAILSDVADKAAQQMNTVGAAQQRVTAAQGQDALAAQQQKQALFTREGLDATDPTSTLSTAIDEFNTAHARTRALLAEAQRRDTMSIGDIFKGTHSVGEYLDAKLINPADQYLDMAKQEAAVANDSANQVAGLENMYTNASSAYDALHPNLTAGIVADKAVVAAAEFTKQATQFQIDSLIRQSKNFETIISNSTADANTYVAMTRERIQGENAKRMWAAQSSKTLAPEEGAKFARIGLQGMGIPGAENLSSQLMKEMENNPLAKARFNDLVYQGMLIAGAAQDPTAPLPNLYGTPGEAALTLEVNRGKLPQGSEGLNDLLLKWSGDNQNNPMTNKPYKPNEKVAAINAAQTQWIENNKKDLDSTVAYGHVPLQGIVASAAFNTPEMAPAKAALTALSSSLKTAPLDMVTDAILGTDMPDALKIKAILNYGNQAALQGDSLHKPQIIGMPTAASLGYTGYVKTGSVFGGKMSLNAFDEKQVTDFVFKRGLAKKVGVLAPADALDTTVLGRNAK